MGITFFENLISDVERLTNGSENLILGICFLIIFLVSSFLIIIERYVDPYEIATAKGKSKKEKMPLVSFFVAVRNDEVAIVDCVKSMLKQTYRNREIFVIDDYSEDNTSTILKKEFGENPDVNIIYLKENVGKKRALAKAIQLSKGELFAFTDSDSVWEKDAIERVVAIFENEPDVGAISGHCNAKNANTNFLTKIQNTWYEKQYRLRKGFESVFRSVSCVSGPLACYRRKAVYNYIPSWENDQFLGREFKFATDRIMTGFALGGSQIGPKLKKQYSNSSFVKDENYPDRDWDVLYCNSAKAWTIVPDTIGGIISQKIRWNKSFIRNLFFTGTFYWKKPLPVALYYYLQIIFVFAYPLLITALIGFLIFNGYSELLVFSLALYGLISILMNSFVVSSNTNYLEPIFGSLMYHLIFQWLIFYSMITINNRDWKREIKKEG